ncbi:MAG: hypothetical protein ACI9L6_001399 [Flavobacterium sp.]|jgi:hypothetical protein
MRKISTLFAVIGMILISSCEGPQGPPGFDGQDGLIAEVFEVTTSFNSANNFSKVVVLTPTIYASDVVLVYRLVNVFQGQDVWKLLPDTHYFNDGTRDFSYDFDFTISDVNIYMVGNNLETVADQFRLNQVLRIVIVPGSFSAAINKNSYTDVMAALNMKESQVQNINF